MSYTHPFMNLLDLGSWSVLGLGFLLGLRHATDPDHVIAITAITTRTGRLAPAAWLGLVWGLGHSLSLWAVGACIILFGWVVPPRLGLALEFVVAMALIGVGLLNLRRKGPERSGLEDTPPRPLARRAFVVGILHGLAGSAAVALLVLATVRDPWTACGYLLVFALGTMVGMGIVTTTFAAPVVLASRASTRWLGAARWVTGALSVVFGLWLAWRIGWVDGLFSAHPDWTPH